MYIPSIKSNLVILIIFCSIQSVISQKNPFVIEGTSSVSQIIHSLSGNPTNASILFLRDDAFTGTDWRIGNFGGTFKIYSTLDNFQTAGTEQFQIFSNGRFNIVGGTEANPDNAGGRIILGDVNGMNLALDEN